MKIIIQGINYTHIIISSALFMLSLFFAVPSQADETNTIIFASNDQPFKVLEMYSSQGCSSCPPAEKWLSQLKDSEQLFTSVFPLVFHVDYWDYIGWSDTFGSAAYSKRQASFQHAGAINSVYTPEFVVNGNEWRGWFAQPTSARGFNALAGMQAHASLLATVDAQTIKLQVIDNQSNSVKNAAKYAKHKVNIVLLGIGLKTQITRGENSAKTLIEDFVVLDFSQSLMQQTESIPLPTTSHKAERYALVVYVTTPDGLNPQLVTGGYLPTSWAL